MSDSVYIDEEGITYYEDGTYQLIEGGERYSAPGIVAKEAVADEATGEGSPEESGQIQSRTDEESQRSDFPMEGEPGGSELDAGEADDTGDGSAEVVEGDAEADAGSQVVYEGVTTEQFAGYQQEVYSRLDALNTVCIVLVIAIFFSAGIAAVDTLLRSTERF